MEWLDTEAGQLKISFQVDLFDREIIQLLEQWMQNCRKYSIAWHLYVKSA